MTMAWCKKIFYECVACVCLTFGTIFLVIASSMVLYGCDDYIICPTNWFIQIFLEFKKILFTKILF